MLERERCEQSWTWKWTLRPWRHSSLYLYLDRRLPGGGGEIIRPVRPWRWIHIILEKENYGMRLILVLKYNAYRCVDVSARGRCQAERSVLLEVSQRDRSRGDAATGRAAGPSWHSCPTERRDEEWTRLTYCETAVLQTTTSPQCLTTCECQFNNRHYIVYYIVHYIVHRESIIKALFLFRCICWQNFSETKIVFPKFVT